MSDVLKFFLKFKFRSRQAAPSKKVSGNPIGFESTSQSHSCLDFRLINEPYDAFGQLVVCSRENAFRCRVFLVIFVRHGIYNSVADYNLILRVLCVCLCACLGANFAT